LESTSEKRDERAYFCRYFDHVPMRNGAGLVFIKKEMDKLEMENKFFLGELSSYVKCYQPLILSVYLQYK
jgi:hypothetical protein